MIQEDISLDTGVWNTISCTGSALYILVVSNCDIAVRFGATSTSQGFEMHPGDTLSANETVYVKVKKEYLKNLPYMITVAR